MILEIASSVHDTLAETLDLVLTLLSGLGLLPRALAGSSGRALIISAETYLDLYLAGILIALNSVFAFLVDYRYSLLAL